MQSKNGETRVTGAVQGQVNQIKSNRIEEEGQRRVAMGWRGFRERHLLLLQHWIIWLGENSSLQFVINDEGVLCRMWLNGAPFPPSLVDGQRSEWFD